MEVYLPIPASDTQEALRSGVPFRAGGRVVYRHIKDAMAKIDSGPYVHPSDFHDILVIDSGYYVWHESPDGKSFRVGNSLPARNVVAVITGFFLTKTEVKNERI